MKKHRIFTCTIILIIIAIFTVVLSCSNFGIPETVEIKTNARYALNMGFDVLDMSKYLSPEEISKSFTSNPNLNVYDYNPGGTSSVKHLLIEYPAINQSIDISKHFDNLDFGTKANGNMGFDETFKVESIALKPRFGPLSAATNTSFDLHGSNPITVTIGNLGSANLSKAVIKTGKIILSIPKPAGWSNVTATVQNGTIELDGGIQHTYNVGTLGSTDQNYLLYKEIDLAGRDFTPSPVELKGTIKLSGPENTPFYFNLDLEVTEYTSVTVGIGNVNTSFTFTEPLPTELSNFVQSIECNKAGVAFKYKNNLPNANTVNITIDSTFLGIPSTTGKLDPTTNLLPKEISDTPTTNPILINPTSRIDVNVNLSLPGANTPVGSNDTFITVTDIKAGQTYSLAFTDFQLILDWEAITVDSNNPKLSSSGAVDMPIDFNEMFKNIKTSANGALSDFVDKLEVDDIPIYMYVSKPSKSSFNSLTIAVNKLEMTRNDSSGSPASSITLLPNVSSINMTDRHLPGLESGKTVRTDFSKLTYLTSLERTAFKTIINQRNKDLKLDYNIAFGNGSGTFSIKKTDVDSIKASGGALDIKAAVYIDIPLKLTLKNPAAIDLMSMAGMSSGSDLIGRNAPLSLGEYENYMNAIKSMELIMNMKNSVFFDGGTGRINFVIDDSNTGSILGSKNYPLSNLKIGFTTDETKKILKSTPPYMPDIKIDFPQGSGFQIPQSGGQLGFSGKVAVTTDGSIIIGDSK